MKKFYLILFAISIQFGYAQTVVFSENMGTPPTGNPTATAYTGYQNGDPVIFTGNATIRTSTPSENYEGASGEGSVFIGASIPSQSFTISGINTSGYSNLVLSLGHYKTLNAGSNELTIEVSADGTNWLPLTYSRLTGLETSNWILITPSGTIPSTSNLRIRFTNPTNSTTALSVGFRIDDIKITGNALSVKSNTIAGLKVYPNPLSGSTLFIDTNANAEKTVVIYDVLGKVVLNTKTASNAITVSNLNAGVYIVKITEEGNTATRKLVIR